MFKQTMCIGSGYRAVAVVVLVAFFLGGCAGLAPHTATVNYYCGCYEPISKVREEKAKLKRDVALGILGGAAAGVGVGVLTGNKNAVVLGLFGLGGAVLGGSGMYYINKRQQIQNDEMRRASIAQDMEADTAKLDSVTLASMQARKCYREQFNTAIAEYKAGRMSKDELKSRVEEIVSALNEIEALMKETNGEGAKTYKTYEDAITQEKAAGGPGQIVITPAPAPAAAAEAEQPAPVTHKKSKKKRKVVAKAKPAPAPIVIDKYQALDDPAKRLSGKVALAGAEATGAASDAKEYMLSCNALGLDIAGAHK